MIRLLYFPNPFTLVMTDDSIAVSHLIAFSYKNTQLREEIERGRGETDIEGDLIPFFHVKHSQILSHYLMLSKHFLARSKK